MNDYWPSPVMNEFDTFSQANVTRPRWVRRLNHVLLVLCAVLMAVVLMSQPKIASLFNLSPLSLAVGSSKAASRN